jgi:hypothetical protein
MDDVDLIYARAVDHANRILQGATAPYDGAKALWNMESSLNQLTNALLDIVGLASEWEDHPEQRAEIEREIVVQADRLRARFGK